MLKLFKTISCLMIALAVCASVGCQHTHDENCGYNPNTDNSCVHVHPLNEWEPPIG